MPGERYDVLITGLKNPTQKNYRFIFETTEYYDINFNVRNLTIGLANLQYEDAAFPDIDQG